MSDRFKPITTPRDALYAHVDALNSEITRLYDLAEGYRKTLEGCAAEIKRLEARRDEFRDTADALSP